MLEYDLGTDVRAFTTTRFVNARRTNPQPLSKLSGLPAERIVIPHQVHTTRCLIIDESFMSLSEDERAARLEGIDAVATQLPSVLLCISTADCIPVIIYDSVHHVIATIHAGWRGTVQHIVTKTFAIMQKHFGTRGADCRAVIGPGISLESFEVGDEVYERFLQEGFDMSMIAQRFTKWHINLKQCNFTQLTECAVPSQNIQVSDICTLKDHRFFSARREGIQTGRNMTCIYLNNP